MKKILIVIILLFLGIELNVIAYEETGHFYTAALSARGGTSVDDHLTESDRRMIALCTQLPDQAQELDAMWLYFDGFKESFISYLNCAVLTRIDDSERKAVSLHRMVTVQQLLHALTGGDSEALTSAATATVDQLWAATSKSMLSAQRATLACSLGFALHLLGDAHAHRKLGNESEMYPTGRGHGLNSVFPDQPLFRGSWFFAGYKKFANNDCENNSDAPQTHRLSLWYEFLRRATRELRHTDAPRVCGPGTKNSFLELKNDEAGQHEMRNVLWQFTFGAESAQGPIQALRDFGTDTTHRPCQDLVNEAYSKKLVQEIVACSEVWNRFSKTAEDAFDNYSAAREPLKTFWFSEPLDFKKIYRDPTFRGDPWPREPQVPTPAPISIVDVRFATDSSALPPEEVARIVSLRTGLANRADGMCTAESVLGAADFRVGGYQPEAGVRHNEALSAARAYEVYQKLQGSGMGARLLNVTPQYKGSASPRCDYLPPDVRAYAQDTLQCNRETIVFLRGDCAAVLKSVDSLPRADTRDKPIVAAKNYVAG